MGYILVCVVVRAVAGVRCLGCGSVVGGGARFCPNCGAPLGGTVPLSCVVYLFGDRFVSQDRLLGEKVPCSEAKVNRKALAQEMMRVSFASLAAGGVLSLKLGQRRVLLFKTGAVFAALNKQEKRDGLEGRIIAAFTGDPSMDNVEEIVARAVGEECADPWGAIIDVAREHLLGLGYFEEGRSGLGRIIQGRKLLPDCQRINTLQGQVPTAQTLLRERISRDTALDKQLGEDIKKGITSRYQTREIEADE